MFLAAGSTIYVYSLQLQTCKVSLWLFCKTWSQGEESNLKIRLQLLNSTDDKFFLQ